MMPTRMSGVLGLVLLGAALAACGGDEGGGSTAGAAQITGLELDSELTPDEVEDLESSLDALQTLGIDGSKTRWFAEIFGGNRSSDVASYFDTRIHFFISSTTDMA